MIFGGDIVDFTEMIADEWKWAISVIYLDAKIQKGSEDPKVKEKFALTVLGNSLLPSASIRLDIQINPLYYDENRISLVNIDFR